VQQLGDRACGRRGPPAALCGGDDAGGSYVLGADAESLVSGGAAFVHAGDSLAAEIRAAGGGRAVHGMGDARAAFAEPAGLLSEALFGRGAAAGGGGATQVFSWCSCNSRTVSGVDEIADCGGATAP